jgi:hypothetical protein
MSNYEYFAVALRLGWADHTSVYRLFFKAL